MNQDEARAVIIDVLADVAPEIEPDEIEPDENLQEQLDIDSIDFLNLITGVHEATGIDIPERDYPKLDTLDGFVAYLVGVAV